MRRFLLRLRWAALLLALILLSGCWGRREINQLSFNMAMGLDKGRKPGTVQVTFEITVPSLFRTSAAGGGGLGPRMGPPGRPTPSNPVWITTVEGKTVMDAIRRITEFDPRRGYGQHMTILVIGEALAREGILPVIDAVDREPEARRSMLVFVAKGTIQKTFQAAPALSSIPAMGVLNGIPWLKEAGVARPVILNEVIYSIASQRREVALPVVYPTTGRSRSPQSSGSSAGKKPATPVGEELRIAGMAVFKQEKLAGFLNRPETRGYLWLMGEDIKGIFPVQAPEGKGKAFLEIRHASTTVKPLFTPQGIRFRVRLQAKYEVAELSGPLDITQRDIQLSLSRRLAEVIRNDVRAALNKLQGEWQSDVLGFGDMIYRRRPKVWRSVAPRWPEVFASLPVDIEVNTSLQSPGRASQSYLVVEK